MKKIFFLWLVFCSFSSVSQAALIDVGNGLINDTAQKVFWLKDTNLFKTLCDANDPVAMDLIPVNAANAGVICANDGAMTWNDARAWIKLLNEKEYLGQRSWRQPVTPVAAQPDLSCETAFPSITNGGYNCRGSELGHLFNVAAPAGLANPNDAGTGAGLDGSVGTIGTNCAPNCFVNTGDFSNTSSRPYWMDDGYGSQAFPDHVWGFDTRSGFQGHDARNIPTFYVWPVRPTQTDNEPECDGVAGINTQDVICVVNAVLQPIQILDADCDGVQGVNIQDVVCVINAVLSAPE